MGKEKKKKTFSHFLNARAEGEVVLFCSQSKLRWRSAPSELLVTPTDNFRNYLPPLRPGGCVWQFNWQSDILTHVAPWAASGALFLSLLTQLFFITFRGKKTLWMEQPENVCCYTQIWMIITVWVQYTSLHLHTQSEQSLWVCRLTSSKLLLIER